MIVRLGRITRRSFVARSATFFSGLALSPLTRWSTSAPIALRIGVATPGLSRDQRLGLELGLDEARHAATLFGGTIVDVPVASPDRANDIFSAIIGGGDESAALNWTRHAARTNTIYMNVGCTSDRLRRGNCSPTAFHVVPSDAMARDALAAAGASSNAHAEAWDASLNRFGADTLNQRFLTRFHDSMTSGSWAAWFAVKAIWESALRQKSADAKQIAEYLVRDTTQFDGHKGTPLSFRSWDHQLRQPIYVVSLGNQPRQMPELTGDDSVRDALDRLGRSTRAASCESGHE